MILLLHVKNNKTKLSKICHPYNNTRNGSGHISYERLFDWVMGRAKSMYVRVWCKKKKLQVRGTPCKCCSRSQQRSSPGLRLRLTPLLLVLIERVWWISHSLITSSATLDMTKHISHTHLSRRSCRPARCLSISTHNHTSKWCLATALRVPSSITTGHYVLNKDVDPKRLGSENNAMKEAQRAHT